MKLVNVYLEGLAYGLFPLSGYARLPSPVIAQLNRATELLVRRSQGGSFRNRIQASIKAVYL